MIKKIFSFLGLLFFLINFLPVQIKGQGIFGAEISYEHVSGNDFIFNLTLYKECAGSGYPSSENITIERVCGSDTLALQFVKGTDITPICSNTTSPCQGGTSLPLGIAELTYRDTINIPGPQCGIWTATYQECCRDSALTNLSQPATQSLFITATGNSAVQPLSSGPVRNTAPLVMACSQQPYVFNPEVTDPDGDSLSFSLIDCKQSPFQDVVYQTFVPIQTIGGINVNPVTGTVSFTPSGAQNSVWCMKVDEYRNGVKIGEMNMDIPLIVLDSTYCSNPPPEISGINGGNDYLTRICPGQPVDFTVHTSDQIAQQQVQLSWNNGIPSGNMQFYPGTWESARFTWTPTASDIGFHFFTVTAIDDGCPMAATAIEVFSFEVREPEINLPDTVTVTCGNQAGVPYFTSVDFDSLAFTPKPDSVFSDKAFFSPKETTVYQVTGSNGFCSVTDSFTVEVKDFKVYANIANELENLCNGGIILMVEDGTPPFSYSWNTGDTSATLLDLCAGDYQVTVIDSNGCSTENTFVVNKNWVGINETTGFKALNIFPNPAKGRLHFSLELDSYSEIEISLMNMYGNIVLPPIKNKEVQVLSHEMDVSGLPGGVYFIQIKVDDQVFVKRITVL